MVRYIVVVALLACGAEGPPGEAGEDGANGVDGVDGIDNRITASIYCGGLLASTTINFAYHAALTEAGDIFASGSISTVGQEVGASSYYAAGQNGAATAPVLFTGDVLGAANSGWWQIGLNRTSLITTIAYNDADATGGQDTWTMASGDCVLYSTP